MQPKDLSGNRYGKLTVIGKSNNNVSRVKWQCICDCGVTTEIRGDRLKAGQTNSCGCLQKEKATTHGGTTNGGISLYWVWANMCKRCNSPNSINYLDYGGRGITVTPAWLDFLTFKQWAEASGYNSTLQLDRANNALGYSPENCRWVPGQINARNRRSFKGSSSKYVGVSFTKASGKWQARLSIDGKSIHLGYFLSETTAAEIRDSYIKANNLQGFTLNFK